MFELTPVLKQRFFDANGLPLAGGQLFTYLAGTTTPLATYTDSTGVTPNANPVILDSSGYANIWMGPTSYKFVLEDSLSNIIFTIDNVQSISSQIALLTSTFANIVIPYTSLQAAGLTNTIPLFILPAKSILGRMVIKHSSSFTGTSISAVSTNVGITGVVDYFLGNFDILQAVADQAFESARADYIGSFANPTQIYLNAVSVGANLSALSQGSLTVYYEVESLIAGS